MIPIIDVDPTSIDVVSSGVPLSSAFTMWNDMGPITDQPACATGVSNIC